MATGKKIGARIVLDGEAEFRQSINNSKSALKAFDSELKLTQTQFKNNEKSMEALKKTQEVYLKQQKELQKQEKSYVEQLKKAADAHKDAKKAQEETAKTIDRLNKELDDAKKQYGENSKEVEELNKELEKAENEYKKQGTAIGNLEGKMSKWEQGLNETRTQLVEVDRNLEETNDNIENFGDAMDDVADSTGKANPELSELSVSMGKLVTADLIADGIKRLASAVVDLAKSAIDVGMEFESSMSKVAALSGATGKEYDQLAEKARDMGATTMYSASEAADAFSYMALAGWDTKSMLEGIEPVLNLAAASNMELAEASDIVTDYLTAFGLEAKDAAKFTDQLAYAMANSNTDVEQLGEAYKNCAAAAGSMGYSVEDVTSALMTMANAGVKGGEAGTSLRGIMINLATNVNGCADALEEFGVEVYDLETGEMNSLSDILISTASAFDGLSDAEANSLAKTIAGKTQFTGFETILLGLNDAAKASGKSFEDYAEALKNCDGYASDMANTMQNNLQGKLTILQSSLEALGESAYDVFKDDLKDGVDVATDAVSRLNEAVKKGDLNTSLKRISGSLNELIDKMADWVEHTLPSIIDGLADLLENSDKVIAVIKGMVAAFATFKSITGIMSVVNGVKLLITALQGAAEAQAMLNSVSLANPYVLLATAIVGVGVAVDSWAMSCYEADKALSDTAQKSHDLSEEAKQLTSSIEDSAKARSDELAAMDTTTTIAHNLTEKLTALQVEYKNGTDNMAEMKFVVDQLNEAVPGLNLAINEQTGELNKSTSAIHKNIDALMQQAKIEAANEHLVEIAKEQLDAEIELQKVREQKIAQMERVHSAVELANEDAKTHTDMNGNLVEVTNEYTLQLESERAELENLNAREQELVGTLESTQAEMEQTTAFVQDNSAAIVENANAVESTSEVINTRTAEWVEAYNEAYKAASDSLNGQNVLLDSLSLKADTTIGQMAENVKANADVFKTYAEDLKTASELANTSTDPQFKAIIANIESMGVDGAGYLHELVEAAQTDSDEFNTLLEEWATMDEAKNALAETMATFEADYQLGTDNMKDIQQTFTEDTENSVTELTDNVKETVTTANEEIQQNVDESLTGFETSIENAVPIVEADAQALADAAKDTIEEKVNHDEFYTMGEQAGQGLADGLRSKIDEVKAAAQALADAANNTVSGPSGLDEHSPSKKMHEFGYLGGVGLAEGFEEAMPKVIGTINDMMPNERNVEVSSIQNVNLGANMEGNGTLARINGLLDEYLPTLASLKVVMDTGKVVGELSGPMNREFGRIMARSTIK